MGSFGWRGSIKELEQKQRLRVVEKRLMEAANGYIVALNRFAGAWVSTPRIQ